MQAPLTPRETQFINQLMAAQLDCIEREISFMRGIETKDKPARKEVYSLCLSYIQSEFGGK